MTDYTVYCHVCPYPDSGHLRPSSRLIGCPSYGALWHCPTHSHPDQARYMTGRSRGRLMRRFGFPLMSCGCPADPDYGDPEPDELPPTCDLCHLPERCDEDGCHLCPDNWNGDTGCHRSCEDDTAAQVAQRGHPDHA